MQLSIHSFVFGGFSALLGLLSLGSAEFASLEGGSGSELNVLFRADSYHETRDGYELFADSDVSLSD
jgi:hypothetical protein